MLKELINNKLPDKRLTYREINNINLPMLIYNTSDTENKKRSLVVCIHGGGWTGRKNNDAWNGDYMGAIARYFAMRGAVGIVFSYRDINLEGVELKDLYEDCLLAMRYILNNAESLGIDVEKIAVLGDSAGGHLASCLGTLDLFRTNLDKKPTAVVSCNPITDLTDPKWMKNVSLNENIEESAKLISPLYHVSKDTSPTLLIHGTTDNVVSCEHSVKYYDKMKSIGNACEIELIEGANHAFILPEYYKDEEVTINAIKSADKFLVKMGILD